MQYGFYQSRSINPKVDGKNGGSHNRILFREQHQNQASFDTVQVFVTDEQLADLARQASDILGMEFREPDDLVSFDG